MNIEEQKEDSGSVNPALQQYPCCAKPFWTHSGIEIWNENCLHTLKRLGNNSIDLTVTSPPYDKLRTYKGFTFPFKHIARHLYRVTKDGGVVVWVVNDATVNGTETGTSFQQALFFKECGFFIVRHNDLEKNRDATNRRQILQPI